MIPCMHDKKWYSVTASLNVNVYHNYEYQSYQSSSNVDGTLAL